MPRNFPVGLLFWIVILVFTVFILFSGLRDANSAYILPIAIVFLVFLGFIGSSIALFFKLNIFWDILKVLTALLLLIVVIRIVWLNIIPKSITGFERAIVWGLKFKGLGETQEFEGTVFLYSLLLIELFYFGYYVWFSKELKEFFGKKE